MAFERRGYFNVQVIAAQDDENRSAFTIYCEEQEFSSIEYGGDLFKIVAGYVVKQRQGGQRYPIFITDLDLPPGMLGEYSSSRVLTADFLSYKRNIEFKLNEALQAIDGTN